MENHRRELFLPRMKSLIPWVESLAVIEPFNSKETRDRHRIGLERRLDTACTSSSGTSGAASFSKSNRSKRLACEGVEFIRLPEFAGASQALVAARAEHVQ